MACYLSTEAVEYMCAHFDEPLQDEGALGGRALFWKEGSSGRIQGRPGVFHGKVFPEGGSGEFSVRATRMRKTPREA